MNELITHLGNQLGSQLNTLLKASSLSPLSLVGACVLAYVGGLLTSLTPCVYPMLPITFGVMGGLGSSREALQDRRFWPHVLIRSLSYIAGIAIVYSFLGVLAGLTGQLFGAITQSAPFYLILGLVTAFAALVMLGWIDLHRIPGLRSLVQSKHRHDTETLWGVFAVGASSALVAAPCTTPILTGILSYIAQTQSVILGFTLMLSYSLGLGSLLMALAIAALSMGHVTQKLPRSGPWLRTVQIICALILITYSLYLFFQVWQALNLKT